MIGAIIGDVIGSHYEGKIKRLKIKILNCLPLIVYVQMIL